MNAVRPEEVDGDIEIEEGWPAFDLVSDSRFEDFVSRRYRRELAYEHDRYIDLLASYSAYRVLDEERRDRLLGEARVIVARSAGPLTLHVVTDLFLGRTTGPTTREPDSE